MARKPDYGKIASSGSAAAGSALYGGSHIFEWDLVAQVDSHAAAMLVSLGFLFAGGLTIRDKFDEIRS